MSDLFEAAGLEPQAPSPLADRLRPQALGEVVAQQMVLAHHLGQGLRPQPIRQRRRRLGLEPGGLEEVGHGDDVADSPCLLTFRRHPA